MADPNTRQGKRTPVTLKIKFKSETLEQFIERYAVDVSQGGIFIRTKEPLAVGTQMKFEFQLRDASPLIGGEGTVVWTRENDPSRPAIAPGMGVRFDKLADGSQQVLEKILAEKAKQAPARGSTESNSKPPMFTDTPTRVASAAVVAEAMSAGRARRDSEQTPLPNPVPFHSDADDFDESAFAEATKVRSLEELVAQTADGSFSGLSKAAAAPAAKPEPSDDTKTATKVAPVLADELAQRRNGRADSTLADPPTSTPPAEERESAPVLPSPPQAERKDATPTPTKADDTARKKADAEKEKAAARSKEESAAAKSVAKEAERPTAPARPSSAPILIGILVLVAAAMGAVWFFVLREDPKKTDPVVDNTGSAGSAAAIDHGSAGSAVVVDNGSAGSAVVVDNGSAALGSGVGSGSAVAAAVVPVNTLIASNVAKGATIEVLGTDQKGPAPLTAKLEKDKVYKARVTAPGFIPQEIDVKGGQDKVVAKLVAKTKVLSVTTDPAGADIYVDGVQTGKITPSEVELTPAQAARPRNRITLKRPGYKAVDQYLAAKAWTDGDTRMTGKLEAKLVVQPKIVTPPPTGSGTGSDAGSGDAGGGGGGSATTTPTPTSTPTPTPTPPAGGSDTGSAAPQ